MAKRKNEDHPNRHCAYVATSGFGKGNAIRNHPLYTKRTKRMIGWDPHEDFQLFEYRARSLREFYDELLSQAKEGKRISIALTMEKGSAEAVEIMCNMIWQILDGKYTTVFIYDEAASTDNKVAKAAEGLGTLAREGRKFGLVMLVAATRFQEISKTLFSGCSTKYMGAADYKDAKAVGDTIGVSKEDIAALGIGEFYEYKIGPAPATKVKMRLKKEKKK